MLQIKNVNLNVSGVALLHNISIELELGKIYGILGPNGAGKTTTFRMIIGLLEPTSGEVTLDGKKIDYSVTDTIGFLTEERSLLTKMTVKEQCHYYGILKGMTEKEVDERLDHLLDKFGISSYKDKKIKELSKGNQQKIQFITALLNNPRLLILDEPFSGLDPFNVELFKNEIKEMAEKGSMIIFSSHRMEHVELFCKKIAVLKNGKDVLGGDLKDIKKKYRKKNILVKADIDVDKIKSIDGVLDVIEKPDEYEIKISDETVEEKVFKEVSKCKNVTKFAVEEPSLNEIFIDKVGENYEN